MDSEQNSPEHLTLERGQKSVSLSPAKRRWKLVKNTVTAVGKFQITQAQRVITQVFQI